MFRFATTLILFSFSLTLAFTSSAAIYQYKDEDANITYSDELTAGGKRINENAPSVAPKPKAKKTPQTKSKQGSNSKSPSTDQLKAQKDAKTKADEKRKEKAKPYTVFKITDPKDDQAIRRNNGNVEFSVLMTPALQTKFGHKIQLIYDGKKLSDKWQSSIIELKALDRGTHTISAIVIDKADKTIKQSKPITFHLLRFSRLLVK